MGDWRRWGERDGDGRAKEDLEDHFKVTTTYPNNSLEVAHEMFTHLWQPRIN